MSQKSFKRRRKQKGGSRIDIVHEDLDIIVINKPSGLLSVPIKKSRAKNARDMLNAHLISAKQKAIIVHRIDRFTSGLMVFAKNKPAHANLVKQFLAHTPNRVYLALVRGRPAEKQGELRHYLKRIKQGFRQVVVESEKVGGTLAITRYRVAEYLNNAALVEIYLQTGLKNQIRVQLHEAGHTIIGDQHYSPREKKAKEIDHQALHAYRLGFLHPSNNKYVEYQAQLPKDFADLLNTLRKERK